MKPQGTHTWYPLNLSRKSFVITEKVRDERIYPGAGELTFDNMHNIVWLVPITRHELLNVPAHSVSLTLQQPLTQQYPLE